MGGGNTEVKIAEPIIYDDYNGRIRADQDCIGTLTTNCGNDALRNGVKIIEPVIIDEIYNNREPRVYSEFCSTIRAERQGLEVIEPNYRFFAQAFETFRKNDCEVGDTIDAFNKRVNKDGISPTLTTRPDGFKTAILPVTQEYRIRKLTERECWRLMGVKEQDFEKASKNQSMSSLYHLAGDSICVSVLMAIFGELLSVDYQTKINELVEKLKNEECKN